MRDDFLSNPASHPLFANGRRGRGSLGAAAGAAAALGALAGCGGGGGTTASSATGGENTAPVALTTGGNVNGVAGAPIVPIDLSYGYFNDADDDALTYTVAGLDGTGLSYDGERRITGTVSDPRTFWFTVTASDGQGGSASRIITLTTEAAAEGAAARPTVVSNGLVYGRDAVAGDEIDPVDVAAGFADPDAGDADLDFDVSFSREDSGLTFDPASGMITGEFSGTGNVEAVVTVTNGEGENATSVEHRILFTAEGVDPVGVGGGEGPGGAGTNDGIGDGTTGNGDGSTSGSSGESREAALGGLFVYQPAAAAMRNSGGNVIYAATLSNGDSLDSVGLEIDPETGVISGVFTGSAVIDPEDQVAKGINPKVRSDEPEDPDPEALPNLGSAPVAPAPAASAAVRPLGNEDEMDGTGGMDGDGNPTGGDDSNEDDDVNVFEALTEDDITGSRGEFDEIEIQITAVDMDNDETTVVDTARISFDPEESPQPSVGTLQDDVVAPHGEMLNIDAAAGFAGDFEEGADLTFWAMGEDPVAKLFHGEDTWRFHLDQMGIAIDPDTGMISGEYDAHRDIVVHVTASDGDNFVTKDFGILAPPVFVDPEDSTASSAGGWLEDTEISDFLTGGQLAYGQYNVFGLWWYAFSPSGDQLTYEADGLDGTGLEMNQWGWVYGELESADDVEFELTASRDNGASVTGTVRLSVNRPPEGSMTGLPDKYIMSTETDTLPFDGQAHFVDPEGGTVTIEAADGEWNSDISFTMEDDSITLSGLEHFQHYVTLSVKDEVGHEYLSHVLLERHAPPFRTGEEEERGDVVLMHGLDIEDVWLGGGYFTRLADEFSDIQNLLKFSASGLEDTGIHMTDDGRLHGRPITGEDELNFDITITDMLGGSITDERTIRVLDFVPENYSLIGRSSSQPSAPPSSPPFAPSSAPSWDAWVLMEESGEFSFDASKYAEFARGLDVPLRYSAEFRDSQGAAGDVQSIGLDVDANTGQISGTYTGDGTGVVEIRAADNSNMSRFGIDVRIRTDSSQIDIDAITTVSVSNTGGMEEAIEIDEHFFAPTDDELDWVAATVQGDSGDVGSVGLQFNSETGVIMGNFDEDREIRVLAHADGEYYANIFKIGPRFDADRIDPPVVTVDSDNFVSIASINLGNAFLLSDGESLDIDVSGLEDTGLYFSKHETGAFIEGGLYPEYFPSGQVPDSIPITLTDFGGEDPVAHEMTIDVNWRPEKSESHSLPTEVNVAAGSEIDPIPLTGMFRDPDGDDLTFELEDVPELEIDMDTLEIKGTFDSSYVGQTFTGFLVIKDGRGGIFSSDFITFNIIEATDPNIDVAKVEHETDASSGVFAVDGSADDAGAYSNNEWDSSGHMSGPVAHVTSDSELELNEVSAGIGQDGDYLTSSLF